MTETGPAGEISKLAWESLGISQRSWNLWLGIEKSSLTLQPVATVTPNQERWKESKRLQHSLTLVLDVFDVVLELIKYYLESDYWITFTFLIRVHGFSD